MDRDSISWMIPVLLAVLVGAGLWFYWSMQARDVATVVERPVEPEPELIEPEIGPLHPITAPDDDEDRPQLRPLPELANSDEYFKLELSDLFGPAIGNLIADSRLIERVVATVDNLPRGHVAERTRPVKPLSGPFEARTQGGNLYSIAYESYRRYDPLVEIVSSVDTAELIDLYRRYYPLFQDAYVDLGYPDGYFNDRLVEAIDDMLATPEVAEPVMLVRPHVLYEYEDTSLESSSAGQKLILRMGADNAAKIKSKLREIRAAIVNGNASQE